MSIGVSLAILLFMIQNPEHHDIEITFHLIYIFFFTALASYIFVYSRNIYFKNLQEKNLQITNKNIELEKIKRILKEDLKRSYADNLNSDIKLASILEAKKEIFQNLSHEINTPIQVILELTRDLQENWNKISDVMKMEQIKTLNQNSFRLRNFLSDLFDISKLDSGKMLFKFTKFNLKSLIEEVILESEETAADNQQKIIFNCKIDAKLKITADRMRIKQVIYHLLSNAIKFSESQKIEISASKFLFHGKIEGVEISVIDHGIGIDEMEINEIFEAFIQGTHAKANIGGAGLGLAIARNIISNHGGHIWANNSPHKGAEFHFFLPFKNMVNSSILNQETSDLTLEEPPLILGPNSDLKNDFIILVVEDELLLRNSLKIILKNAGFPTLEAEGGFEAMQTLNKISSKIKLIITDMMMPDIYGIELIRKIKANKKLAKIPIIVQSGVDDSLELKKIFEMGVECCITKPYDKNILLDRVFNIYEKFRNEHN